MKETVATVLAIALVAVSIAACDTIRQVDPWADQVYDCTNVMDCEGDGVTMQRFPLCTDREGAKAAVEEWLRTCDEIAGINGCATWHCEENCHPTGQGCERGTSEAP